MASDIRESQSNSFTLDASDEKDCGLSLDIKALLYNGKSYAMWEQHSVMRVLWEPEQGLVKVLV